MAIEFKLPQVSEGVESADIAEIRVSEGDVITSGQVVLEVETEKAAADIECPHAGKITKIHVKPGQKVKIGETLLTVEAESKAGSGGKDESSPPAKKGGESAAKSEPAKETAKSSESKSAPSKPPESSAKDNEKEKGERDNDEVSTSQVEERRGDAEPAKLEATERGAVTSTALSVGRESGKDGPPPPATPTTRRMARELGVDLNLVKGSGPGGRITDEDVQAFVRTLTTGRGSAGTHVSAPMAVPALPDFERWGPIQRQPMNKLARTAAAHLSASWQSIPHVTHHEMADITALETARKRYMDGVGKNGPKVTMTAIMIKAVVGALKAYPKFNASLDSTGSDLILKNYYHIGVAVDTEHGLVVPVIRDVDRKSVVQIASDLSDVSERARLRKLDLAEMQGGTFTITNLGGIGGIGFTPIVNYPEVAILGMSRTQKQWDFSEGKPVEQQMLPLSLSYDHRVVNGADAARFMVKLSRILSDFFQLLVEC